MTPVKINGQNVNFTPPEGWEEERHGPCGDLGVRMLRSEDQLICESAWRPSEAELQSLQEGHAVILRIYGRQPAVALYVEPVNS